MIKAPTEQRMHPADIQRMTSSIQRMYGQESPAPSQVLVYPATVKPVPFNPGFFQATVKIIVRWCSEKHHKVNIKFQANNLEIIPQTLSYL